jgi:hypothetical protein
MVGSILAMLLLALAAGLTLAQEPQPPGESVQLQGDMGIQAALGTAFTYQGQLKKAGNPVNDFCNFQFSLWDAATEGNQIGSTQTKTGVSVSSGFFTVQLDFGAGAFKGDARWLQIAVKCPGDADYITLSPRQPLTPAPYALALPGLWTQQNATSPNIIGGYSGNRVTAGVVGATIGGGGASWAENWVSDDYGTVGGGRDNRAGNRDWTTYNAPYATVGGGDQNTASGSYATVGGGNQNTASGSGATVGGGDQNTASGPEATVGGGWRNTASGCRATIGGGHQNTANDYATVGGGESNNASSLYATVGGGNSNNASGSYATVGGGDSNEAIGSVATIGGGGGNTASGNFATIGGGEGNIITFSADYATIAGGTNNRVTDSHGTIGGGGNNQAGNGDTESTNARYATVSGGINNTASGERATVGGGEHNTASGDSATVGGGYGNTASGWFATVGGGRGNNASTTYATVGGGWLNTASADYATIAGGGPSDPNNLSATNNRVTDNYGTIGGGGGNRAGNDDADPTNAQFATVSGGRNNTASGSHATVGGGFNNTASMCFATIGGGRNNVANSSDTTIGGGENNSASGYNSTISGGGYNTTNAPLTTVGGGALNTATGWAATVPGGYQNSAQGEFSFAAGRRAKANHNGAFVWADSTDADFASTAANQFAVRATGGVSFSIGSSNFLVNGNTVWHAGNDGSGSGLDADTVDGLHASAFAPYNHPGGVPIIFDDFDRSTLNLGLGWLASPQWITSTSGLGSVYMDPDRGLVIVDSGYGGAGAATLYGKKQRSVLDGTLIFKANLLAYEDNNIAYGDGLPRGLVNGTNRNNAIEFINYTGSAVKARTVKNGVATETVYYIPGTYPENSVDAVRFYMIVATATEVKFYLDGVLIATHTTNIPTVPLNPYFGVWYPGYGTVSLGIDYVSFEIIR